MKLKIGDRVEVLSPPEEKGMRGIITAGDEREFIVKITRAGSGHNTTKLIGKKLPYFPADLKGI